MFQCLSCMHTIVCMHLSALKSEAPFTPKGMHMFHVVFSSRIITQTSESRKRLVYHVGHSELHVHAQIST